ncbi:MAG: tetratricopeptide repeat protein [Thermoanaerobaculia bacterium]|nr:tetratricopeptide repeat protein [Thermoanaerobaculia bacterium]MBP9824307.1 tetratricopeptide repeat protein [Thermoanaerobaculia bacterium]
MIRCHRWFLFCVLLIGAACLSPAERQAALFAQADAAAKAGDLPRAIAQLKTAVGYDPSDVEAVTRLAEVLIGADLAWEAKVLLDRFPADAKRDDRFLNLKARLLIRFGRLAEALPILLALDARGGADPTTVEAAVEAWVARKAEPAEFPDLPGAWRLALVGECLEGQDPDLAAQWLRTVPGDSSQEEKLSERVLAAVLQSDDSDLSDSVVALAGIGDTANKALTLRRHLASRKNWSELHRVEERFLADYPGHSAWSEVALAKAWRSLRAGDPQAAERLAAKVAALDPESVEPLVVRGLALRERGREGEARKALELALALDPTNVTARRALLGQEQEPGAIRLDLNLRGANLENR